MHGGGIIGPYFLRNEEEATVTVNGKRCRAMLTDFLFPNGAINYQFIAKSIWFKAYFQKWSCKLAPSFERLSITFNGDVKTVVYADKPVTLEIGSQY